MLQAAQRLTEDGALALVRLLVAAGADLPDARVLPLKNWAVQAAFAQVAMVGSAAAGLNKSTNDQAQLQVGAAFA